MIDATFTRLQYMANGLEQLGRVREPLASAAGLVSGTAIGGQTYVAELSALNTLANAQHERLADLVCEVANQLGWQVATYEIAPIARESGEEPVVFITGNSYMPPLRELGPSNGVWNIGTGAWEAYVEGIEARLDELNVYMGQPECDNSLYVVDLARFESVGELAGDTLQDDWQKIRTKSVGSTESC